MVKKISKKFDAQPLIFEALKEKRKVSDVVRYIRKNHGNKEVSPSSIYYWINKIRKGKEPKYKLIEEGEEYQIILRKTEKTIDELWCKWFMESYKRAIENKDRQMIILLMIELQDKIFEKTIEYEPFIDFLKDIAKKQNYEYFENLGMYIGDATIIPWKCIEKLYHDYHESNNDYLLKKIKKMETFFKNVALDWNRKYSIERLMACYSLQNMRSPLLRNVIIELIKNADPNKNPKEYPGSKKKSDLDEYSLFRMMIRHNLTSWLRVFKTTEARQILIDAFEYRKKKFGPKDKELDEILMMFKWMRDESKK